MSEFVLYEGPAPETPPAGGVTIYAKIDGKLYWKTDDGTETAFYPTGAGLGDLLSDGSVPLAANWDVGAYEITMLRGNFDTATGQPITVVSQDRVVNLNADLLDGYHASAFQLAGTYLQATDIDTLAELNGIVADATLFDFSSTSLVGAGFFLDEDNMISDDATKVASQQSIKAYIDTKTAGALMYQTDYNAGTNTPDLTTSPNAILKGQYWVVSVAGTFFGANVEVGDTLIAEQDDPSTLAHWTVLQTNLDAASIKSLYESNADTNAYDDAAVTKLSNAVTTTGAGEIAGLTEKVSPVGADVAIIEDSAAGNVKKKVLLSNMLGGGGGMTVVSVKTANYTANPNEVVPVDSTGGSFTITYPASPAGQDRVIVMDVGKDCTTNPVTIARNGNTIDGAAEDFVIDQNHGRVDAIFDGTSDWETHLFGTPEVINVNQFMTGFGAVNAQTGTTYTFITTDLYKLVRANNAASSTYSIPDSFALEGETLNLLNVGAGSVTIAMAGGATDTLDSTNNTCAQDEAITIVKDTATTWRCIGGSA